jgi:DNA polymerase-3 subunit epsilon
MNKQIILDTETTGLSPLQGHRVIEIGAIEMIDRKYTNKHFHIYLNPECKISDEAIRIHGITNSFVKDKAKFNDIALNFINFIKNSELIIHNANFDINFLNYELKHYTNMDFGKITDYCKIIDTLALARKMHPGKSNSLDALSKRYNIKNFNREKHGALLDSKILGSVYLEMTRNQNILNLDMQQVQIININKINEPNAISSIKEVELIEHKKYLNLLKIYNKKNK